MLEQKKKLKVPSTPKSKTDWIMN